MKLSDIATMPWDVVVLGAGPAGAMAAVHLFRKGLRVLLCDKAIFPRDKVCGGCLNQQSLACLKEIGIDGEVLRAKGAKPVNQLHLFSRTHSAEIPLREGLAISRATLDQTVVDMAAHDGAVFLPGVRCTIEMEEIDAVTVSLVEGTSAPVEIKTKVAIVATGLVGRPVRASIDWPERTQEDSRIGAGAVIPVEQTQCPAEVIQMLCGSHGYVGMVRIEGNWINLAAAIDPEFIKESNGVAPAIQAIAREAGYGQLDLPPRTPFHAVPALTRSLQQVAFTRIFVIGDAAGYVEPFTGQGMAWAYRAASLVAPLAALAAEAWDPALIKEWQHLYDTKIRREQRFCALLKNTLRHQRLSDATIGMLSHAPWLARPLIHYSAGEVKK